MRRGDLAHSTPFRLALTFGALTYGLIEGAQVGFAAVLWAFGLSLAGLVMFVVSERRGAYPILPLKLLRARVFVAANVYTLLVYSALGGSSFFSAATRLAISARGKGPNGICAHRLRMVGTAEVARYDTRHIGAATM